MTFRLLSDEHIINSMSTVYEAYFNRQNNISKIVADETIAVKKIGAFFQVTDATAVITAILWCNQVKGNRFQLNKYMKKLEMDTISILECNAEISEFKKKAWLIPSKRAYEIKCTDDFLFSKDFMYAITTNAAEALSIKIEEDFFSAMIQMHRYIKNILSSLEFHSPETIILEFLEKVKHFEPITTIMNDPKIEPMEKVLLAYMVGAYVTGESSFDLDYCLNYINPDGSFHYKFKDRVVQEKSVVFSKGYLTFYTEGFADFSEVNLGSILKEKINHHLITDNKLAFKPRMLTLTKPEELHKVSLYFNENLNNQVTNIMKITSDSFQQLEEKMVERNLKPGLTLLFHGNPGTGKTELVKQIAFENNRLILSIDSSKIINKHVGESEKNVKLIFNEYKEAKKHYLRTPILLLNEADALISKRNSIEKSIDQMYNTLQNILLQELEDFEGIFIATTNMIQNIDLAFDRRFLYKIGFDDPNSETRLKIWEEAFPQLNHRENIAKLNQKYLLSGGQINSIKKRSFIENLLFETDYLSSDYLEQLAQEELYFRDQKHLKVGF